MRSDVVVTGLGAVSGFGAGVLALETGLLRGETAIGDFGAFDHSRHRTHVASEVPAEIARPAVGSKRGPAWTRADRFAVRAAQEAVDAAGVAEVGAETGVFFGSSTGGLPESEEYFAAVRGHGGRPQARQVAAQSNDGPGNAVARALAVRGPVETFSSACTSASLAMVAALDALHSGEVDVAIAGGADSLCQVTYAGFNSLRSVDAQPCRPYRADRAGLSLGEGAAVLVLETAERAAARGAEVLAVFGGAAATCDASHMSAPDPEGRGAALAIERALQRAEIGADGIDFVNVHGTGTPHNDRAEWQALLRVFGDRARAIPVTATKGLLGHLLGSSGSLEAVAALLCLRRGILHPVPDVGTPIDPDLPIDLVHGDAREVAGLRAVLSTNLAFGGTNTALVFGVPA